MKKSPQHFMAALGVGFVLFTGITSVLMFFRVSDYSAWVAHTLEVQTAAHELLGKIQDAETGQRGYLLTHNGVYLEPYESAVPRIQPGLEKLRNLTSDNPAQQQLLQQLGLVVASRLDILRETIALAKKGDFDRATDMIKEGKGKALMDNVRALILQFCQTEQNLLTQRQDAERKAQNLLLVLILGSLGLASAVAVSAVQAQMRLVRQLQDEAKRREAAEASLRQAQKMEAIGQLTGGVAHDFNNLLTVILGNLDTIRRRLANIDAGTAAPLMRPTEAALQSTKSAAKLTHRLLAFSRQQALDPEPLDLNKLLSGLSDLLSRTVGSPATLETVLMAGLWLTFADANQLENALINLAINARDAMPNGGKITIETANAYLDDAYAKRFGDVRPGQYVVLSVSDTGCGIAPEILERVFEPFFTTKQVGAGTGLGLSMVHGFVKQSGGHIRIYSEVSQGTTVKIYLPRYVQATALAAAPTAIEPPLLRAPVHAKASETVLVVEDNAGVLEFAVSVLEDLGYRVLSARNGPEALRILESEPSIDLLFTDVVLPEGMTGRQLAEAVLSHRPKLPVLFTTGYSRNAIVHQGRLDANVHLLSKPYTQVELAQTVRALLDSI
jgi:signal transduction histidine kinase